ncbi:cytochrome c oxidase subunit II [Gammaproteobacteria bacterium LSUCC0057]|uniref:Cytochrome c oxidase subunit 2 n=1 Tax=Gammaproteobacteria bacterium LSUCC0057 TaxID=2559237 RepID=A0A4Y8UJG5_9GAMM|nr:cytochrome c oxidase subunit II [Gammaproteobacteria bacterium LSUCC0057]
MLKRAKALFAVALTALVGASSVGQAAEVSTRQLNMPQGVTEVSQAAYDIHMLMMWVCVVIGAAVFGFMIYVMFAHRKSRGVKPANFHEHVGVELAWTIVPALILIVIAFPATNALLKVYDASEAEMDIKITGYQWKWQYEYLGEDVRFMSSLRTSQDEIYGREEKGEHYLREVDNPLVIPADTKVRFLLTGNDVIHSWWVPDLGVKKDALPGIFTEAWAKTSEVGVYVGECAELCGKDHAFMPIVVEVKPKEEFNAWLAEQKAAAAEYASTIGKAWSMDELMERGEQVYLTNCAGCHGVDGLGIPGVFPPMVGSEVTMGPIEKHIDVLVNGVQGTAMQAFAAQLSEVDIAAVVTYERNAWGNDVGDMAQPIDVLNHKNGQ